MFTKLAQTLEGEVGLQWQARFATFKIGVESAGAGAWTLAVDQGAVSLTEGLAADVDVTMAASAAAWTAFLETHPRPGYVTLTSMLGIGALSLRGDMVVFARYKFLLNRMFMALRAPAPADKAAALAAPEIEPVVGRYIRLNIDGRPHRVYFEEAGAGVPLLCLHTAGADGRQYRHLLNDPEITANYRVIVMDMPWHGKSAPPAGFQKEFYKLTTEGYMRQVLTFANALGLEQPVVMGCSIGGRVVLHLAKHHGDRFRAAIGLQSALYADDAPGAEPLVSMSDLYRGDVHAGLAAAAGVAGVVAPQSPEADRWETLWYYMQGGPGVFLGDLNYYMYDGDLRNGGLAGLDVKQCPLHLLTGDYDISATPERTQELADEVGATSFTVMRNLGHFPMSENHAVFRTYLLPVLEQIRQA